MAKLFTLNERPTSGMQGKNMSDFETQSTSPSGPVKDPREAALGTLREDARMTQAFVASALGVTPSHYSRIERDPSRLDRKQLKSLSQLFGISIDALSELIDRYHGEMAAAPTYVAHPGQTHFDETAEKIAILATEVANSGEGGVRLSKDLESACQHYRRDRVVAIVAPVDSGKTTIASDLTGTSFLPIGYQPVTNMPIFLRHISARPSFVEGVVSFYDASVEVSQVFALDETTHKASCVYNGDYVLLNSYAKHRHDLKTREHNKHGRGLAFAVVYLEADALKGVTLVDLPGQGGGNRDDDLVEKFFESIELDGVIYLSSKQGFLDANAHAMLAYLLSRLPIAEAPIRGERSLSPLANLLIVMTHVGFSDEGIDAIMDTAALRLQREFEDIIKDRSLATGKILGPEDFRARMISYEKQSATHSEELFAAYRILVSEVLPQMRLRRFRRVTQETIARERATTRRKLTKLMDSIERSDEARHKVAFMRASEAKRARDTQSQKKAVRALIARLEKRTLDTFTQTHDAILQIDRLANEIGERYSSKDEAQKYASTWVNNRLGITMKNGVKSAGDELANAVAEFLKTYELPGVKEAGINMGELEPSFDARGAFAGGLAAAGAVGLMAAWISTLGNLGGYIVVAKAASLAAMLGIPVGAMGTAGWVTVVAALGGPITFTILLAGLLGGVAWLVFGESWEKRLAKRIIETMTKAKVEQKYRDRIHEMFRESLSSFECAAEEVEIRWQEHLQELEAICSDSADPEELKSKAAKLTTLLVNLEKQVEEFDGQCSLRS